MSLVDRVHARVVAEGDTGRSRIAQLVREEGPLLAAVDEEREIAAVVAAVEGLGPLEPLLGDAEISDVLVNGNGSVWVERRGSIIRTPLDLRADEVDRLIERIVAPLGLRVDRSSPLVDARLPDGSRVHAVVPPLSIDGPCLTIRRFGAATLSLAEFASPEVVALLADAVRNGANLVVSGGTGSGKTTLLNALAAEAPTDARIITVEDAAELRLPQPHVVRLESRPPNAEGAGRVTARELVRNALRMRPDRIVVGECRGAEALDMLQAMNTGHEGSMTTCHANSCDDALRRLETMVLLAEAGLPIEAVRDQLASAVDLIVQVARSGDGAGRQIVAVAEVVDVAQGGQIGSSRTRRLATAAGVIADPQRPRVLGTAR